MKTFLLFAIILFAAFLAHPQPAHQDFSTIAETLTALQDTDGDHEQAYENLMQVLADPIDLNKATGEDLAALQILSTNLINNLVRYREENGDLVSIYELQAVPGFDVITINRLLPWVNVTSPESRINRNLWRRLREKDHSYVIIRHEQILEKRAGFLSSTTSDKRFEGSRGKTYLRIRSVKAKDFSVGLTAEKDEGEKIRWDPARRKYGFDFLSGHLQLQNKGWIKNLIVGDFQCQFGQGLILGGPFGLGKGSEPVSTTRKSNVGVLPYCSSNESGFYRGAALSTGFGHALHLTGFYSRNRKDARLEADSTGVVITSFSQTGLHRNKDELLTRQQASEQTWGAILQYTRNRLDAGMIFNQSHLDKMVEPRPALYEPSTFGGARHTVAGGFLNYTVRNFTFFSDASGTPREGAGFLCGLLGAVHSNLDIALVFRRYSRNFKAAYSNGFAESSQPQNETGYYWGWKYNWRRRYFFSGYVDLFRFPWLGFRRYAPNDGHECLIKITYEPGRNVTMFVQAREESKGRNVDTESSIYHVENGVRRNYCIAAKYTVARHLTMQTRVQLNSYALGASVTYGTMLLQDFSYGLGKFKLGARHALFDARDHENRHYVYEADMWMAFSLPAYSGVGVRNYLLLEYDAGKRVTFWIRYARTKYADRDKIGSGLDEIESNSRNDIKVQMMARF